MDHMRIMLPGPTPCPDAVLREMARPMINHRGPEFAKMIRVTTEGLQWFFNTRNDVLSLTASGTGAMESAVVNTLSPGDRVLALVCGEFGKRFGTIAETYGAQVDWVEVPYGSPVLPEHVEPKLETPYKAVLMTHNETSTAILNPVQDLARLVREKQPDTLLLVDSISGLGTSPLPMDEWDLDVVLAASQKAFMMPPGLAFAAVSPRAWKAHQEARMPRFYFDYGQAKRFLEKGQTPWTPAISLFFALQDSLEMLKAEGLERIHARHERLMKMVRAGARAMGMRPVAENDRYASRAVTGLYPPEGVSAHELRQQLQSRFGYVVAGGQGPLADSIFRVGHLGYYDDSDVLGVLAALEATLTALGASVEPGSGVGAAQRELRAPALSR